MVQLVRKDFCVLNTIVLQKHGLIQQTARKHLEFLLIMGQSSASVNFKGWQREREKFGSCSEVV